MTNQIREDLFTSLLPADQERKCKFPLPAVKYRHFDNELTEEIARDKVKNSGYNLLYGNSLFIAFFEKSPCTFFFPYSKIKSSQYSSILEEGDCFSSNENEDDLINYDFCFGDLSKYFLLINPAISFDINSINKKNDLSSMAFSNADYIFCHNENELPLMVSQIEGGYIISFVKETEALARDLFIYFVEQYGHASLEKDVPQIEILSSSRGGALQLKSEKLSQNFFDEEAKYKIDFFDNYNPDFGDFYNKIRRDLKDNTNGIVLLHGLPGTGKTTTIRRLCHNLAGKRDLVYVPPGMAESLGNPGILDFFVENSNKIFILEDAETILRKRENASYNSAAITNLLNISDGLVSDIVKISIIATFNCEIDEIDDAFLRNGRQLGTYEFKLLEKDVAKNLFEKLQITPDDIFPFLFGKKMAEKKQNSLGFGANRRTVLPSDYDGWTVADIYAGHAEYIKSQNPS